MPRWGALRIAGCPAPEGSGGDDYAELDGRDLICDVQHTGRHDAVPGAVVTGTPHSGADGFVVIGAPRRRLRRRWPGVSAGLCLGRPARRTPGHMRKSSADQCGSSVN